MTAMGQMFYSLSIAMGILITFGSYMKRETSIEESTKQVEIFDTAIAMMAGLMIIPAVFAFSGGDAKTLQPDRHLCLLRSQKFLQVWVLELLQALCFSCWFFLLHLPVRSH